MHQKFGVRSGVVVVILAQSATLFGCWEEAAPGDGDGDPSGDGGAFGDGDGDAGDGDPGGDGDPSGDGDRGGNGCENLLADPPPLVVFVTGGGSEDGETCRVEARVSFDGEQSALECVAAGPDCHCYPVAYGVAFQPGMTLEIVDGSTVLFSAEDLRQAPSGDPCVAARYGDVHVDYVEALVEAVGRLDASLEELASPETCEIDTQCEALALGAKACGGPRGYAIVSNQSETYGETVALSEELERIESLHNSLAELTSDCAYEVAPEVSCGDGVCIATPVQ